MLIAIGSLTIMGLVLGGLLGAAARFLAVEENPLEEELKAMLPGSQCGQCGYVGCAQYAAALAKGEASVTLCAPGGKVVIEALAKKLGVTADLSEHEEKGPEYAFINEDLCIGCTRCIRECSTDAILGANKLMHTVIVDACHGCGKCAKVCPTDAIVMVPVPVTLANWYWPKPEVESTQSKPEVGHAH
ncbi:MAG TPA: RnfABCDGE type electron transport complex subunit B [Gallionellaceae bacterium]|nr:RnfABCDGE type electron transport complex subunit B [Gallionellaceae bacterium]